MMLPLIPDIPDQIRNLRLTDGAGTLAGLPPESFPMRRPAFDPLGRVLLNVLPKAGDCDRSAECTRNVNLVLHAAYLKCWTPFALARDREVGVKFILPFTLDRRLAALRAENQVQNDIG